MVFFKEYYGVKAAVVKSDVMEMTFLPGNGGRLVSLKDRNGNEWMAYEGDRIRYRGIDMNSSYVDADVCGMDDMFPTIDPEKAPVESDPAKGGYRCGVTYPDHGQIARSSFDTVYEKNGALVMEYASSDLFYAYRKTVCPAGNGITIKWNVENLCDEPFPFLWAAHCMLASEKGDRLVLPYENGARAEIMFDGSSRYGKHGDKFSVDEGAITSLGNFSDSFTYKFYFDDSIPKGEIKYVRKNGVLTISYDEKKLPYLGVWINNGGFKNSSCVTPEPCTLAYDTVSEATRRGQTSVIPCRGYFDLEMHFSIE